MSRNVLERKSNMSEYRRGVKSGVPICLGYIAVSFSLGLAARRAGLSVLSASVSSLLLNASAGEYALFSVISEGGSMAQAAVAELVANMRYFLMSCALSEKLDRNKTGIVHRLVMGLAVTDEMFSIGVMQAKALNPWFYFGMMSVAVPGWCVGTGLGAAVGNIIGSRLQSALGVSLYGMFIASVIPVSVNNKKVAAVVIFSALLSMLMSFVPLFSGIPESVKVILLTVLIAVIAALVFPIKEKNDEK